MSSRSLTIRRGRTQPRLPPTFRALRHRNYRLFFFGQMVSLVGTWMQSIAQQWLIYRLTGSAAMLGTINLLGLLPVLPLSLVGGTLADRFPRRSIIVIAQSVMMVQAFVLATLVWTNVVQVWHVLVLALLLSAANAIDLPARQAFVVDLVEGKDDLTNAIGLNSTVFNLARAVGPAVAGALVAATGEGGAFFINGLTFIAVIAALLMMRLPSNDAAPPRRGALRADVGEAARFVVGHQVVLLFFSLVAVSAFLSMPYSTLLPVFSTDVLGPSAQPVVDAVCSGQQALFDCREPGALTYGLLMAATGIGAVIGALLVASLPNQARRGRWLTLGNLIFPGLLIVIALSRSFTLTFFLLITVGVSFVVQNALVNTLIQIAVPDELRGRVMSFYTMTFQAAMSLGGMQAGLLGDWLGAPLALGLGAVVCWVYGMFVAWRYPVLRKIT